MIIADLAKLPNASLLPTPTKRYTTVAPEHGTSICYILRT